jgi:hypothetical protein
MGTTPIENWKLRARALAPKMPEEAAERAAVPLQGLEDAFRPLVAELTDDVEPAYVLLLHPEAAE